MVIELQDIPGQCGCEVLLVSRGFLGMPIVLGWNTSCVHVIFEIDQGLSEFVAFVRIQHILLFIKMLTENIMT